MSESLEQPSPLINVQAFASDNTATPPPDAQAMTREQMEEYTSRFHNCGFLYLKKAFDDHDAAQRETIRRLEQQTEMLKGCLDENRKHAAQLQARLTASEAKHKWTTARPTQAGWYWWRKGHGYSNDMVAIFYDDSHSEWEARFLGLKGGKIGTLPVNVCDGEWQGPLTPGE